MKDKLQELLSESERIRHDAEEAVASTIKSLKQEVDEHLEAIEGFAKRRLDESKQVMEIIKQTDRRLLELREKLQETYFKAEHHLDLYRAVLMDIAPEQLEQVEKKERQQIPAPTLPTEFESLSVREAAKIILERVGRPLYTAELAARIQRGGKEIQGEVSSKVSAALRTEAAQPDFKPIKEPGKKLKWGLRKWEEKQDETVLELEG